MISNLSFSTACALFKLRFYLFNYLKYCTNITPSCVPFFCRMCGIYYQRIYGFRLLVRVSRRVVDCTRRLKTVRSGRLWFISVLLWNGKKTKNVVSSLQWCMSLYYTTVTRKCRHHQATQWHLLGVPSKQHGDIQVCKSTRVREGSQAPQARRTSANCFQQA